MNDTEDPEKEGPDAQEHRAIPQPNQTDTLAPKPGSADQGKSEPEVRSEDNDGAPAGWWLTLHLCLWLGPQVAEMCGITLPEALAEATKQLGDLLNTVDAMRKFLRFRSLKKQRSLSKPGSGVNADEPEGEEKD